MDDSLAINHLFLATHAAEAPIHGSVDAYVIVQDRPVFGVWGWEDVGLVVVGILANLLTTLVSELYRFRTFA